MTATDPTSEITQRLEVAEPLVRRLVAIQCEINRMVLRRAGIGDDGHQNDIDPDDQVQVAGCHFAGPEFAGQLLASLEEARQSLSER